MIWLTFPAFCYCFPTASTPLLPTTSHQGPLLQTQNALSSSQKHLPIFLSSQSRHHQLCKANLDPYSPSATRNWSFSSLWHHFILQILRLVTRFCRCQSFPLKWKFLEFPLWLSGNEPTSIHEDVDLIPGPAQWVMDLRCVSCNGYKQGLDPTSLWQWHRPAATAPIRPLVWEPPCA